MTEFTRRIQLANNLYNPISGNSFNSGLGYHPPPRMEGTGNKKEAIKKYNDYVDKIKNVSNSIDSRSLKNIKSRLIKNMKAVGGDNRQITVDLTVDFFKEKYPLMTIDQQSRISFIIKTLYDKFNIENLEKSKPNLAEIFMAVDETPYIQTCEASDNLDEHGLSYLVRDLELSHSDKIKLGTGVERAIEDFVLNYGKEAGWINIKEKNMKGVKETDHLFANHAYKLIVYGESKANLNLDTEKCKATSDKINGITENLIQKTNDENHEFYGYKVSSNLLALRYIHATKETLGDVLYNKYHDNKSKNPINLSDNSQISGMNDYLKIFGFDISFTENEYINYITYICVKMFKIEK